MQDFVPKRFFLTRGVGVHRDRLVSFELALRDARIPHLNLVTVSSILPPGCEQLGIEDGLAHLPPGQIAFCILARADTDRQGLPIAAAVSLARHSDPSHYGYIAEHHGCGQSQEEAARYAEHMARIMLVTAADPPGEVRTGLPPSGGSSAADCLREIVS